MKHEQGYDCVDELFSGWYPDSGETVHCLVFLFVVDVHGKIKINLVGSPLANPTDEEIFIEPTVCVDLYSPSKAERFTIARQNIDMFCYVLPIHPWWYLDQHMCCHIHMTLST